MTMIECILGTILVIDDNPVNLQMLCSLLKKQGYAVIEANEGRNGLKLAFEKQPDLILLDIVMPGLDGYEVCRRLKADAVICSIPVLMVSGEHDVLAKVRCFDLGAADYITKPYNHEEILARIRTHLQLRQLSENLQNANDSLRQKQQQLDQDMKAAAEIQMALLPKNFPDTDKVDFSFAFNPCNRIGGDLFNVQRLDQDHLGIYVLDVSGHGVSAAMLTALVHQAMLPQGGKVKQITMEEPYYRLPSPVEVHEALETAFPMDRFERYFTMAYLLLNFKDGRFSYSCAGHPPIIHMRKNGEIIRHHKGGVMIGAGDLNGPREEGQGQLQNGDRLIFFTDGILENEDVQGNIFGLDNLEHLLTDSRHLELDTIPTVLMQNLQTFCGMCKFQDDIAFLVLEFTGEI
ncbi:MAG: response regulator [Desulfobulbaceae bacterium]|nr:MAG: response regulator [Desulfobulbaceae bacterium]